jgi:hypothetical protein
MGHVEEREVEGGSLHAWNIMNIIIRTLLLPVLMCCHSGLVHRLVAQDGDSVSLIQPIQTILHRSIEYHTMKAPEKVFTQF